MNPCSEKQWVYIEVNSRKRFVHFTGRQREQYSNPLTPGVGSNHAPQGRQNSKSHMQSSMTWVNLSDATETNIQHKIHTKDTSRETTSKPPTKGTSLTAQTTGMGREVLAYVTRHTSRHMPPWHTTTREIGARNPRQRRSALRLLTWFDKNWMRGTETGVIVWETI